MAETQVVVIYWSQGARACTAFQNTGAQTAAFLCAQGTYPAWRYSPVARLGDSKDRCVLEEASRLCDPLGAHEFLTSLCNTVPWVSLSEVLGTTATETSL